MIHSKADDISVTATHQLTSLLSFPGHVEVNVVLHTHLQQSSQQVYETVPHQHW